MVVIIIGIAAAIVVPRVSSMGDLQVASAARTLVADLQYAQNEAIVTQRDITVAFSPAASTYLVRDDAGVTLSHPLTKQDYVMNFPATDGVKKVRILSADFGGNALVSFNSLGAPSNGGQVTLSADGISYQITVAAVTGKISAQPLN